MKLRLEHKPYGVIELFDTVASNLGYANVDELRYDCREINVAANIQDGFYEYYMALARESDKTLSETNLRAEITILLAMVGPKVDKNLADDEVETFDGFIC